MILALWIVAAFAMTAAVRKAWREASAADRAETELDMYKRRVYRHRREP